MSSRSAASSHRESSSMDDQTHEDSDFEPMDVDSQNNDVAEAEHGSNSSDASSSAGRDVRSRDLFYRFNEHLLGLQITIFVDRGVDTSEERLWLHHVSPLFASSGPAFARYRQLFRARARMFGKDQQTQFAEHRASRSEAHLEAGARVETRERDAQTLLDANNASKRSERRTGAKQFKRKAQVVLNEAANRGDALVFKSDRGRDALRRLSSTAPTEVEWKEDGAELSGTGAQSRAKKLRIYENVAMPVADPSRKVRSEQKSASRQQSAKERGFYYLLSDDNSNAITAVEHLDAKAKSLTGLLYHPLTQLERLLANCLKLNELSEFASGRAAAPRAAAADDDDDEKDARMAAVPKLILWGGGDGVTPNNRSICLHLLRLIDPERVIFEKGYSPSFRCLAFWGLEGRSALMAGMRNDSIAQLCSMQHSVHARCSFTIGLEMLGADNKFLSVELATAAGSSESRCFLCSLLSSEWQHGLTDALPVRTVGDTARKYLRVLWDVLRWLQSQQKRPLQAEIDKKYTQTRQQAGCLRFPLSVHNNRHAWTMLAAESGKLLGLAGAPANWALSDANRAKQLLGQLFALDAQLNSEPMPPVPTSAGFDLDAVYPGVAKLHCLSNLGRSLLHDVIFLSLPGATELGGKERQALRRAVLDLASPNLANLFDHVYAHHVRKFYSSLSVFDVCPPLFQSLATVAAVVFETLYAEKPTDASRAMFALCCNLLLPLMVYSSERTHKLSDSAAANSNQHRNLAIRPSLYSHTIAHLPAELKRHPTIPLFVTSEEDLERCIGELQQWHRRRGAHNDLDMEKEALSSQTVAETKAAFAISRNQPERQTAPRVVGLLIDPAVCSHESFAAVLTSFAADVARESAAVRACVRTREDGALFIVPAEFASRGFSELRQQSSVRGLCLCVGALHARECLFASSGGGRGR